MKKMFFSLRAAKAVAVFAALTVLLFAGCNEPEDSTNGTNPNGPNNPNVNGGSGLTITNLPGGGTYAAYVFVSGTDISTYAAISNAYTSGNYQAIGTVSSGNVFTLYGWNGSSQTGAWTGSGSRPVLLLNSNGNISNSENPMY
jgi:hypothetical protein